MKDVIYNIYKERTTKETHDNISDLIGLYIKKNMSVLTDGLINLQMIGKKYLKVLNID